MSSLTVEPRAFETVVEGRGNETGAVAIPGGASHAAVGAAMPDPGVSRDERVADPIGIVASVVAVYSFLIALPLLALVPVAVTALFLGMMVTLFAGVV